MSLHPCGKCCQFLLLEASSLLWSIRLTTLVGMASQGLFACPLSAPFGQALTLPGHLAFAVAATSPASPLATGVHLSDQAQLPLDSSKIFRSSVSSPPAEEVTEGRLPHHFSVQCLTPEELGWGEMPVRSEPAWDRSQPVLLEPLIHFFGELGENASTEPSSGSALSQT